MNRAPRIGYQTLYLWTCPCCGQVWQVRKRPRDGKPLACRAEAEQHPHGTALGACGSLFESNGSRSGLAT